jgi:hypothetical protein
MALERTNCFGTCPAYRITISRRGLVRFVSHNPSDSGRIALDSLPATTLPTLVAKAESAGVFELPERIASDSILCRHVLTDHSTATLTFYWPGARKRLEDYTGCYGVGAFRPGEPLRRLREFTRAIDSVAGTARWARGDHPRWMRREPRPPNDALQPTSAVGSTRLCASLGYRADRDHDPVENSRAAERGR